MNTEKEEPWLYSDSFDDGILAGNKEGLIKLKEAIEEAIEKGEASVSDHVRDTDLFKVLSTSKAAFVSDSEEENSTWWQKLLGLLVFTWFVILPFVAVALVFCIVYMKSTDAEVAKCQLEPLHNPVKRECIKWP